MHKVLISSPYFQPEVERFRAVFEKHDIEPIVPEVRERLSEMELLALPEISEIEGIIAGDDEITLPVLDAAKKLKMVSKWGTGTDSMKEACAERGIPVRNMPNAFTLPVADSVMGYVLAFARRQPWMDQAVKAGVWEKLPGRSLSECSIGVIGVGNCGKAVLRRAAAFGMKLYATDIRQIEPDFIAEHRVEMLPLAGMLSRSDFVSVNCDLNPMSRHIICARTIGFMRQSAVLINTARGPLVNESDLITALLDERIAGAALDVFEHEPLPLASPLRTMSNVMLAPHNANSSPAAWERVHQSTLKNLLEFFPEP